MKSSQKKVVTWNAPNGEKIDICVRCEKGMKEWPRNTQGQEFCQVKQGLHKGQCNICGTNHEE